MIGVPEWLRVALVVGVGYLVLQAVAKAYKSRALAKDVFRYDDGDLCFDLNFREMRMRGPKSSIFEVRRLDGPRWEHRLVEVLWKQHLDDLQKQLKDPEIGLKFFAKESFKNSTGVKWGDWLRYQQEVAQKAADRRTYSDKREILPGEVKRPEEPNIQRVWQVIEDQHAAAIETAYQRHIRR